MDRSFTRFVSMEEYETEEALVTAGWRWDCCPCCSGDVEANMHPDPFGKHTFFCHIHQGVNRGRHREQSA